MKNLKKVLALVLALATVLGLGVTASAKTYTDATKIEYTEAVDVMSAIGILGGMPDGSFDPQGSLTRAQAAKMVAYLLNSGKDVKDLYAGSNTFTDCNYNWAKGYIAYANQMGIVSGVGNGKFDPDGTLTGVQLAKMMLTSLGYDAKIEGYVSNNNWQVNILDDANSAGLLAGLENANMNVAITREQASQMMFNALQADMVDYENRGTEVTLPDGTSFVSGASKAATVTTNDASFGGNMGDAAVNGKYDLQLAEKYFKDLRVQSVNEGGHNGHVFKYKNEDVSDFIATDVVLATSHDGTSFTDLTTRGNKGYIGYQADANAKIYLNGTAQNDDTNDDAGDAGDHVAGNGIYFVGEAEDKALFDAIGNANDEIGQTIEFIDTDNNGKWDAVAITTYTMTQVTRATAKTDKAEANITLKGVSGSIKESEVVGKFADFAKDDVVFHASIAGDNGTKHYIYEATSVQGSMTGYNTGKHSMTIAGTVYTAAGTPNSTTMTDAQSFTGKSESIFYMDANGYVVAVDGISTDAQYAVVEKIAYVQSGVADGYAEAVLIFTDGTKQTVKVDKLGGNPVVKNATAAYASAQVDTDVADNATEYANCVYTYKTDSDGNYELTRVAVDASNVAIAKGTATIGSVATANDNTLFIYNVTDTNGNVTVTTYTGYKNAPSTSTNNVAVVVKDGYASIVFVDATSANVGDTTSNMIVFLSSSEGVDNSGDTTVYEYKAAVNGVVDTYKSKNQLTFAVNTLYTVTIDKDGYISDSDNDFTNNATLSDYTQAVASADANAGTLPTATTINSVPNAVLTFSGAEKVYLIGDGDLTEGDATDILEGYFFWVETVDKTTTAGKVAMKTVYVLMPSDTNSAAPTTLTVAAAGGSASADDTALADGAASVSSAAAGNTITVTPAAVTNGYVKVVIEGAGTTVTKVLYNSSAATDNYTLVAGDLGNNLTVTVTSAQAGKAVVTNTYTISVTE